MPTKRDADRTKVFYYPIRTLFVFAFYFLDQLTPLRGPTSPEKQHCFDRSSPPIIEEFVVILFSVNYTVIEPD